MTFADPVVWIRESQSMIIIRDDKGEDQVGSTHCDTYGFLTSPSDHAEEFAEVATELEITAGSRRALELVVELKDHPMVHARSPRGENREGYDAVPPGWMDADHPNLERFVSMNPRERPGLENPSIVAPPIRRIVLMSTRWQGAEVGQNQASAIDAAVLDLDPEVETLARRRLTEALQNCR